MLHYAAAKAAHAVYSNGPAGDVAEAIAFFAPDRSAWNTASELVVDGGEWQ